MAKIFHLHLLAAIFNLANGINANTRQGHPNIIFILADDLGWNDVGFHGSNEIPTPNIDALAYRGIILNNYYVQSLCTPSRSALMTGKYPIHLGMQHYVLLNNEPRGLPLHEKLLPEYLKDLGYATHAVGKWHLGFFQKEYTPEFRGFDSHFGHWTGQLDYYDHTATTQSMWGLDMHQGLEPDWKSHGRYTTELYTEKALEIIDAHRRKNEYFMLRHSKESIEQPLFLYLSHLAVHSGNGYQPLQAPDDTVEKFSFIKDYKRRKYAAMVHWLDESVGKVVEKLAMNNMLENSIIIVATDNGGAPAGLDNNMASNWPLRGGKFSLWEGGVRGAALIWSPLIKNSGRVSMQMMHVTDWLPTLLSAVNGSSRTSAILDGYDMWKVLSEGVPSERKGVLLNIDSRENEAAIRVGDWKLMIVFYRMYVGPQRWCPGRVTAVMGPRNLEIEGADGRIERRHVDQIIHRKNLGHQREEPIGPGCIPNVAGRYFFHNDEELDVPEQEPLCVGTDDSNRQSGEPVATGTSSARVSNRTKRPPSYLEDYSLSYLFEC